MSIRLLAKLFAGLFTLYLVLIWSGNMDRPAWIHPDLEPLVAMVAALLYFVGWWEEVLAFARSRDAKQEPVQQQMVQVNVHTPANVSPATPEMFGLQGQEVQSTAIVLAEADCIEIRNAVTAGETETALNLLARMPEAVEIAGRLQARFAAYRKKVIGGTAEGSELQVELNQINDAILMIARPRTAGSEQQVAYTDFNNYRLSGPDDGRLWIAEALLGRETHRAEISGHLNDINCRVLTVTGEAGIGKTDICRQVLQDYLRQHPDEAAYWIDVENTGTASELLGQLCKLTGLPPAGKEEDILRALAAMPGLYYLDNLESAAADPQLRPLLNRLLRVGGVRWLASSREAYGGWGQAYPLPELDETNACLLFCRHWNQHSPGIIDSESPELHRFVVERLGCHPLSIVLTASHADFPDVRSVMSAWETQFEAAGRRYAGDADHRLSNLSASLQLSLQRVTHLSGALRLWALSTLFPQGMDAGAQEFFNRQGVFTANDRADLVQRSILRQRGGRLWIIPPLARFAEDKLSEDRDGFSAAQLLDDALPFALEYAPESYPPESELLPFWLARLPFVFNLLRLYSVSKDTRHGYDTLHDRMFNYYNRDPYTGRLILRQLLQKEAFMEDDGKKNNMLRRLGSIFFPAFNTSTIKKANTLQSLGDLEMRMSENEKARALYEQALPLFEKVGSDLGKANTLRSLGDLERLMSENEKARALYEQALPLFEKVGDDLGKANTLQSLGDLEMRMSENEKARALYEQALPLFEKVGSDLGKANTLRSLGDLERLMSENEKARALYEQALPLFEKVGDDLGKANTLKSLGDLERLMSENEKARALYEQALPLFEKVGDDLGKANTLRSLGDLEMRMSENEKARALYEQALPLFEKVGSDLGKANTLRSLGDLEMLMSENEKARTRYGQALPLYEKVGDDLGKANTLQSLGDLEMRMSENEKARALYEQALPLFEKVGDDLGKANTLKSLGDLERHMSENEKARARYYQALPLYEKVGDDLGKAGVFWSLGMLAWNNEQNSTTAIEEWEKALDLFRKAGHSEFVANTLARMARAWQQSGNPTQPCTAFAEARTIAEKLNIPALKELVEEVKSELNCPET